MMRALRLSYSLASISLALTLATLAGCVVERTGPGGPKGVPLKANSETDTPSLESMLKPGPTAATGRSTFGIRPLGQIPYDGFTLPLVSPDGKYVVTQVDEPPGWAMVMAQGVPNRPIRARQRVYDVSTTPPSFVEPANPLPGGVLLGRSANAAGYLVEEILGDGARRIGRVGWTSGLTTWLADDGACNAFAADAGDGTVVYSSRRPNERAFALVVLSRSGARSVLALPDESLTFPLIAPDGKTAGAFSVDGAQRLSFVTLSLSPQNAAENTVLSVLARHQLASRPAGDEKTTLADWAYLAAASVPASPLWHARSAESPAVFFSILSPKTGRAALLDPFVARGIDLPGPSISAFMLADRESSVLLTRSTILERFPLSAFTRAAAPIGGVRVLSKPYVVRGMSSSGSLLVVGPPNQADEGMLELSQIIPTGASQLPEKPVSAPKTSENY